MSELQIAIVESPLNGDFARNRRYVTWCCRDMYERGFAPLASHLVAPWFLDDRVPVERMAGLSMEWFWTQRAPHHFYVDLGMSSGMEHGLSRCEMLGIPFVQDNRLPPQYMEAFLRGEAPPHTPGFEL